MWRLMELKLLTDVIERTELLERILDAHDNHGDIRQPIEEARALLEGTRDGYVKVPV